MQIEWRCALDRKTLRVDVAVVGAGIAGLWLANLAAQRGLSVVVCDPGPIGGKQTIASQGIIHSGVKYALGDAGWKSTALQAMPDRWRECLAGRGDIDLRGVPVLADHMHLFCAKTNAKARTLLASRLLASRSRRLDAEQAAPFERGLLLALDDFVIDVPALVRRLASPLALRMISRRVVPGDGRIDATVFLLAAGTGNEALATRAGFGDTTMQRRPLGQAVVRLRHGVPLFAHCLSATFGTEPDMTITSHGNVLYIGGKIASDGALRPPDEQIDSLRRLLAKTFPRIDLADAEFHTFAIDRAEPARGGPRQAGDAFAERRGNCILCWPVKLTLAPRLGDLVMRLLESVKPRTQTWQGHASATQRFAQPPWQRPC